MSKTLKFVVKTGQIALDDIIAVREGKLDAVKAEVTGRGNRHLRVMLGKLVEMDGRALVQDLLDAGQEFYNSTATEGEKKLWDRAKNKVQHPRWLLVAYPELVEFEDLDQKLAQVQAAQVVKAEAAEKAKLDRQAKKAAKQTVEQAVVVSETPAPMVGATEQVLAGEELI